MCRNTLIFLAIISFITVSFISSATILDVFPTPKVVHIGEKVFSQKELNLVYEATVPEKLRLTDLSHFNSGSITISVSIENLPNFHEFGLEAYLIEIDEMNARIIGASERALFYALNSFTQLLANTDIVPGILIIDAPDFPIRGVIEGFYDTPWSFEARKDIIEFLGKAKMNTYVYAPKDDPYHREKWRIPYPNDKLHEIAQLVTTAKANYVDFVFAISPGVSIQFTSEDDWKALIDKTELVIDIGGTNFALLLDDIDPTLYHPQDRAKYGNNHALAQVELCNRYHQYLKTRIPNHRLIVVPTEYYQKGSSPYRNTFATHLDKDIIVYSTGYGIVAETITEAEAQEIGDIWQHDILYWDNYPVNDYNRTRLYMAPLAGRDPMLPHTIGFTFNPMNEAELSKLPLLTCADYSWNSTDYAYESSWLKATAILGGEHKEIYRRFAEQNYTFFKDGPTTEYPTFYQLAQEYISSCEKLADLRAQNALETLILEQINTVKINSKLLIEELDSLATIYDDFSEYFPTATKEATPYLKRLSNLGKATRKLVEASVIMVETGPLSSMQLIDSIVLNKQGEASKLFLEGISHYRYDELYTVQLGSTSVIAPIIDSLSMLFQAHFGFQKIAVSTNMPIYKTHVPSNAVDENLKSFFWSARGQRVGDYLVVDLGLIKNIDGIKLLMTNNNQDYFERCKIEISTDNINWEEVALISGKIETTITFDKPKEARYLKVTGLSDKENWIVIREFAPLLTEDKKEIIFDATLIDIVNKISSEPIFVYEDEFLFTFPVPTKVALAAVLLDPSTVFQWAISYSFDGVEFSEPVFSDGLLQVFSLPDLPIKSLRFIPKEPGVYLRSFIVLTKDDD